MTRAKGPVNRASHSFLPKNTYLFTHQSDTKQLVKTKMKPAKQGSILPKNDQPVNPYPAYAHSTATLGARSVTSPKTASTNPSAQAESLSKFICTSQPQV